MVHSLRENDPGALWWNSKAILAESLSADEANFLLDIDSSRKGFEYIQPRSPLSASGALSALLGLVGHCEKELTIGTMVRTREALGQLIRKDGSGRIFLIFVSYYEVVDKPEQRTVEIACDMLAELEEQEKQFWGEHEERVNRTLGTQGEYVSQYSSVMENPKEAYITAKEVAERLGVHEKTVYLDARKGTLPCHRRGRSVRFLWNEVLEATRSQAESYVKTRGQDQGQL